MATAYRVPVPAHEQTGTRRTRLLPDLKVIDHLPILNMYGQERRFRCEPPAIASARPLARKTGSPEPFEALSLLPPKVTAKVYVHCAQGAPSCVSHSNLRGVN
jgi:hypothetical protein